jgi:hypothetical protein
MAIRTKGKELELADKGDAVTKNQNTGPKLLRMINREGRKRR